MCTQYTIVASCLEFRRGRADGGVGLGWTEKCKLTQLSALHLGLLSTPKAVRATGMGDRGVVTDLTCLSLSVDPELHRGLCAPDPLTDVERAPFC